MPSPAFPPTPPGDAPWLVVRVAAVSVLVFFVLPAVVVLALSWVGTRAGVREPPGPEDAPVLRARAEALALVQSTRAQVQDAILTTGSGHRLVGSAVTDECEVLRQEVKAQTEVTVRCEVQALVALTLPEGQVTAAAPDVHLALRAAGVTSVPAVTEAVWVHHAPVRSVMGGVGPISVDAQVLPSLGPPAIERWASVIRTSPEVLRDVQGHLLERVPPHLAGRDAIVLRLRTCAYAAGTASDTQVRSGPQSGPRSPRSGPDAHACEDSSR